MLFFAVDFSIYFFQPKKCHSVQSIFKIDIKYSQKDCCSLFRHVVVVVGAHAVVSGTFSTKTTNKNPLKSLLNRNRINEYINILNKAVTNTQTQKIVLVMKFNKIFEFLITVHIL